MAYSFKGSINFGLVYIPITLYSCIKSSDIGFNMLDKKTKSRIKYLKTCASCDGKMVKPEDIVKGYEYEKGKYVLFTDEDFEKIKTNKDKSITIEQFVQEKEIDPIYFDRPYYVVPTGGEKAYNLLIYAMQSEHKVGIAKCVIGNKETLIALRAKNNFLLLNTLFFQEDIVKNPADEAKEKPNEKELKLAKMLIESMSEAFNPKVFHNEYKERVLKAIQAKVSGKEIVKTKEKSNHQVLNLMDALQKSIKSNKSSPKESKNKILPKKNKSTQNRAEA